MTLTLTFLAYIVLFIILLIISLIDYRTMRIPNSLLIVGTSVGLSYLLIEALYRQDPKLIVQGLIGAIIGGSMIGLIMVFSLVVFKKEGMGMGDLKLLAMIGLFVGSKKVFYTLFIAIIVGGIYALIVLIKSKKEIFPFGPFLSVGAMLAILWGDSLWATYMRYIGI